MLLKPLQKAQSWLRTSCSGAVLLLVLLTGTSAKFAAAAQGTDAFEQNQLRGRGVNILGYDPI